MPPRLKVALLTLLAAIVAVVIGSDVADESYWLGGLLTIVLLWMAAEWVGGPTPDAWIMAGLLAGYILGNRGFAQFFLLPSFPLLPAEGGMLAATFALALRMAFKQATALRRDGLNFAILVWLLLGAARLPIDVRRFGISALRDSAMVYYACFFFIAQAMCLHEPSRRLLRRSLAISFALLPLVTVAFTLAPGFFLGVLVWNGVPLIYQKEDLIATFLAGGFFYFWSLRETDDRKAWLLPAAVCLAVMGSLSSARAAMVGIAVVTAAWVCAGRVRLLRFQVGLVATALLVMVPVDFFLNRDFRESTAYSVYEHAISIFDVTGTGEYLHTGSGDPGGNNRFRLVWWRAVFDETVENNPVFGLGFGADLAERFLSEYDQVSAEDFSARSPHSMIMTVFGRLGTVGLIVYLTVAVMMVRATWPAFRRRDFPAMGLWSITWSLWCSACFGVVLEGPMGAVLFWTVLGMAHDATRRGAEEAAAAELPAGETLELTAQPASGVVAE